MLNLPYFQQEDETSCVLASVRMILAGLGYPLSEEEVGTLLQQFPQGTYIEALRTLETLLPDISVEVASIDESHLCTCLDAGEPVIAYLQTAHLSYWNRDAYHAVVVVGADAENYSVHDPQFPPPARAVPRAEFLNAWNALGHVVAVIRRVAHT